MGTWHLKRLVSIALAGAVIYPYSAMAQMSFGDEVTRSSKSGKAKSGSDGADEGKSGADIQGSGSKRGGTRNRLTPYIEVQQLFTKDFSPADDVLTYTQLAAGLDTTIAGRNNAVSASVRYERRFGWGKASQANLNGTRRVNSGDLISGIVRGYASIVPKTVRLDVGALATRQRVENNGGAVLGGLGGDAVTKTYSAYVGPSVTTQAGDVKIDGHYRLGYTKVESPDAFVTTPGQPAVDVFDKSIVHDLGLRAGTRPGVGLPVGIGAGVGYYREDITNLDQRVEDLHGKVDVTVPVSPTVALVAGVGYERVKISSRDALLDVNGIPVTDNGRVVTDKSMPRQIAYESNGLIWDVGVIWRPSKRTEFEAYIGRRYGSLSYNGTFSYAPSDRSAMRVSVYDNISGFGGQVNRALSNISSDFVAVRNPITGELTNCVGGTGGGCLANALGSVRSAVFRARGIQAEYSMQFGQIAAGVGAGYDRRKFIAAQGTVLAAANGVIDENYWISAYVNGRIDQASRYSVNAYANWFRAGASLSGNSNAYGATLAYYRNLTDRLVATAALGIDSITRQAPLEDQVTGSASLGLRYTF